MVGSRRHIDLPEMVIDKSCTATFLSQVPGYSTSHSLWTGLHWNQLEGMSAVITVFIMPRAYTAMAIMMFPTICSLVS